MRGAVLHPDAAEDSARDRGYEALFLAGLDLLRQRACDLDHHEGQGPAVTGRARKLRFDRRGQLVLREESGAVAERSPHAQARAAPQ